ncbi:MAG: methylenetetrahydrofolate reductase [Methanosarcina thermophila]|jgi:methylenetetrahydrofolate reductase (NADPH)|uniref:Methylenetetrahydrofolate reductase n=3 Tax=Methanosarcina thermophila TaxID=2210 RepID=A0A1I6XU23_METTE|nr:methylenetetrahydrofolate reductase [Methanosarcina thermophila]ALK05702.1 MAG: 5,10-methylenetetrahydrofolate reductase [Methanosarcina sp. 795]AKB12844.1 5,10-methylenetetrahydrofolate reductase [Methanosarcina thermophila TM-1]AKB16535.1 5,10-methylenetetrahydrofolate reductase [Methanosarcina thermophila CHTI-55]NLU56867.1 5,10-methylenetetrahydrofolate reductase [Methanosarcina thermophila]SFT41576.1 5,10-methylenetetrahydrofolate reductase [Methanosarcina thermophila]
MLTNFREKLNSGKFLVTAEVSPPKGTRFSGSLEDARYLKGIADALNVTDNQCSIMHMSSLAFSKLLLDEGHEPIMQLTCRDRNRIGLQSDLLGAYALGIRNVCLMTGDYPSCGDHPGSKPVYDLDSVQLLQLVRKLDSGIDFAGNKLDGGTSFCAGAVTGIDPGKTIQLIKLEKKVRCGAEFIQTQAVYDVGMFEEFMEVTSHLEVPIIAGLIPLKSFSMAQFMNKYISGISVPEEIMSRIKDAPDPVEEGLSIASETIKELMKLSRGVHIMPVGSHKNTPRLLSMAGILGND